MIEQPEAIGPGRKTPVAKHSLPVPVETGPVVPWSPHAPIHGLAVINIDGPGTITSVNQQAVELTGYEMSELIGLKVDQLVPQQLRKQHARHRRQFAQHPHSRMMNSGGKLVLRTKQGVEVPVAISIRAIEGTGEVRCVIEKIEPLIATSRADHVRSIILSLSQTSGTESSPQRITEFATCEISKLLVDKLVVFWEYDQNSGRCEAAQKFLNGRHEKFPTTSADTSQESQIGRAIETLSDLQVTNSTDGDAPSLPRELVSSGYSGGAAAIVSDRYAPAGVITIYSQSGKDACSEQDTRVLRQVADAVGFSLSRHSAESSLRKELAVQEVLTRVGQVISHATYLRDRFDEVADIVGEIIGHDRMVIASYNHADGSLIDIFSAGEAITGESTTSTTIEGDSDLEDLIFHGKPIIRNLSKPSRASAIPRSEAVRYRAGLKSLMAVPISWRSEVIGILKFRSKTEDAYGPADLSLAVRISDYMAGAIVSSTLVDEVEEQRKTQAFLARIGRVVSENLDLNDLYGRLSDELHEVVPFDRIVFARWHPEWSTIEFVRGSDASSIKVGIEFDNVRFVQPVVSGESITMDGDLMPFEKILVKLGLRTRIQLRIGATDSTLGFMALARESRLGFTHAEETLLAQVVDQIAPALSNAINRKTNLQLLRELSEGETRYRRLFDNAPDMILSVDIETGLILDHNDTTVRVLGYANDELRRLTVFELYHPDSIDLARKNFHQLRDIGQAVVAHAKFARKDGTALDVSINVTAVRDQAGKVISSISTVRDVTESVEAELAAKNAQRLDSENRELVRLNEARSEFLSRVSHELRTPLAALLAFGNILARNKGGAMTKKQLEQLGYIRNNGWRLEELINDLLDVSRSEIGTYEIEHHDFELTALVQESVNSAAAIFEQRRQNLYLENVNEPAWVNGDMKRVAQIMSNLLSNASKYSPDESDIEVRLSSTGGGIEIWVTDQGIGISKTDVPRLFTPFFRVDNEQTRKVGGTGLGLVIVRTVAELHGGNVSIESTLGEGTTVKVFLPTVDRSTWRAKIANPPGALSR